MPGGRAIGGSGRSGAAAMTPADVRSRYEELAGLVSWVEDRPPSDPALVAAVTPQLLREGRLLDAGRFEQWADLWAADAVLWAPIGDAAHPAADQSLFLDDRRRLLERVKWRLEPTAWGQNPPSRTTRVIAAVEAWPRGSSAGVGFGSASGEGADTGVGATGGPDGFGGASGERDGENVGENVGEKAEETTVVARSAVIIDEHRRGRHQQLAGCQIHELVGADLRMRSKILILPRLSLGVRNPSFIL